MSTSKPGAKYWIGALALVGVFVLGQVLPVSTPLIGALKWSCSVSGLGFAPIITASGPLAGMKCQAMLREAEATRDLKGLTSEPIYAHEVVSFQGLVYDQYQEGLLRITLRLPSWQLPEIQFRAMGDKIGKRETSYLPVDNRFKPNPLVADQRMLRTVRHTLKLSTPGYSLDQADAKAKIFELYNLRAGLEDVESVTCSIPVSVPADACLKYEVEFAESIGVGDVINKASGAEIGDYEFVRTITCQALSATAC